MKKKTSKKNSNKRGQKLTSGDWRPTPQQIAIVALLVDMDDHRSKEDKCKAVGISKQTLYNWYKNEKFVIYMNKLLDLAADSDIPDIFRAMKLAAKRGNVQAQRSYLEIRGKFTPKVKHELSGDPANPIPHTVYAPVFNMPTPQVKPKESLNSNEIPVLDQAKAVAAGGVDDEDL